MDGSCAGSMGNYTLSFTISGLPPLWLMPVYLSRLTGSGGLSDTMDETGHIEVCPCGVTMPRERNPTLIRRSASLAWT